MTLRYTATCLFGLEGLLGEEITALGYKRVDNMDGRITFEGDENACAVCNINLRYAERLYLNLGTFDALTFTDLFDGTKALPWEEFIGRDDEFPVSGHAIKSKLFSVPDCQRIVKRRFRPVSANITVCRFFRKRESATKSSSSFLRIKRPS